jgi:hypothetical protein
MVSIATVRSLINGIGKLAEPVSTLIHDRSKVWATEQAAKHLNVSITNAPLGFSAGLNGLLKHKGQALVPVYKRISTPELRPVWHPLRHISVPGFTKTKEKYKIVANTDTIFLNQAGHPMPKGYRPATKLEQFANLWIPGSVHGVSKANAAGLPTWRKVTGTGVSLVLPVVGTGAVAYSQWSDVKQDYDAKTERNSAPGVGLVTIGVTTVARTLIFNTGFHVLSRGFGVASGIKNAWSTPLTNMTPWLAKPINFAKNSIGNIAGLVEGVAAFGVPFTIGNRVTQPLTDLGAGLSNTLSYDSRLKAPPLTTVDIQKANKQVDQLSNGAIDLAQQQADSEAKLQQTDNTGTAVQPATSSNNAASSL